LVSINSTSYKRSDHKNIDRIYIDSKSVSINSTSYKRSDGKDKNKAFSRNAFPLIPLPIKEAIALISKYVQEMKTFPLIPLPIKEAILMPDVDLSNASSAVSINSTSYKRSDESSDQPLSNLRFHLVSINSTSYKRSDMKKQPKKLALNGFH
jgi:hypothetical protein